MKFTEYKREIENGKDFSVCLFEGEDGFFKRRGVNLLKNAFLQEENINYATFNGNVLVPELVASLECYPFMSKKRITVVSEFYPTNDGIKQLSGYLNSPSDQSLLVILNDKPCEKLKKFKSVCVIDCSKSDKPLIVKWIKARCLKDGVEISTESASLLAEYCFLDMSRTEIETQKLIDYTLDKKVITSADITLLVAKDGEFPIYTLTEHIGKKQFDRALEVILDMQSRGETLQRLLTSLYNYFRKLLHASISGKSVNELMESLQIKEYPAKKLVEQCALFKKKALKNAVDTLTDADFNIKSGQKDANEEFWLTFFKIVTENTF